MGNKKMQSKAFANLVASIVLILFELWAWIQTDSIKKAKNAVVQPSVFPRIMIAGMAVFTTALLIQSLLALSGRRTSSDTKEQAESLNPFRDKGVLAALFVIALCALYVLSFKIVGFLAASFLLSAIIMWLIGLRNPLKLLLVSFLVPFGMWLIFYKFLSVNIPMGVFQFLKDLVDKL